VKERKKKKNKTIKMGWHFIYRSARSLLFRQDIAISVTFHHRQRVNTLWLARQQQRRTRRQENCRCSGNRHVQHRLTSNTMRSKKRRLAITDFFLFKMKAIWTRHRKTTCNCKAIPLMFRVYLGTDVSWISNFIGDNIKVRGDIL